MKLMFCGIRLIIEMMKKNLKRLDEINEFIMSIEKI